MRIKNIACVVLAFFCILNLVTVSATPSVSAQSAILIEKNSGRILYAKNAESKLPIASTTKIMTALCALNAFGENINNVVEISANAAGVEGSSMYLERGEKMTVAELLYGLMLSSGNDAAVAIAETVSGTPEKFAELMNNTAHDIGADSTHFTNPNGLPDDEHYSTAHDMAKITAAALNNPQFAEIVKTKTYKITGEGKAYPRTLTNHNKLLNMYDGCIGVKTGFTKAAGRCLVSAAERNGMTLVCVTLNAPSDWSDHSALFDYGFDAFEYKKIIDSHTPMASIDVTGSAEGAVPIYPERDIFYPLTSEESFSVDTQIFPEISAPLSKGESVGKIKFSAAQTANEEINLIVNSDIYKQSHIKRMNFASELLESIAAFYFAWLKMLTV